MNNENLHLILSCVGVEHARLGGQVEGAQPDGVDGHLLLEHLQGRLQLAYRHQHVLISSTSITI